MKQITILILVALVGVTPSAALVGDEGHDVHKRRVVKVVTGDGVEAEEGEDFVFVGNDNEPLVVRSFFFHRGGYLGVQLVDLTPELRGHFGVPGEYGVMISAVSDDGPASRAGIVVGDVITAVNGNGVRSGSELARLIRAGEEGNVVDLEVWRDGAVMTLQATLGERGRPQIDVGPFVWKGAHDDELEWVEKLELSLEDLPENVIRINEDHLEKALGALNERLESPEFKSRLQAMIEERQGMERRIQELETRLRELEQRLQKLAQ